MKNTKLAIVLAALTTGAGSVLAQNEDVIQERIPIPSPPEVLIEAQADQERQLAGSKDQFKLAERSLAASKDEMRLAQARAGEAGRAVAKTMSGGGGRSGGASRTLVIPKDAGEAKNLGEVEEDLNVMAHILDKAASGDSKSGRAMGITVFGRMPGWGGSSPNLYIEGYGALFFVNVNYPLLPPPDKDADADAKEKKNTEWDDAKRELARPGSGGADTLFAFGEGFERQFGWDGGSAAAYDAAKVEDLKGDLIAALKNASHIRKLKADETVTVVVTGAIAGGTTKTIKSTGTTAGGGRSGGGGGGQTRNEVVVSDELAAGNGVPVSAPAKLILRARKADAEAFQTGKLTFDEFRKKVTMMLY